MHRLDENILVTPLLLKRFQAEGEFEGADGRHYAFLQRSNGEFLVHDTHGPDPGPNARIFAMDMLTGLNTRLNNGGAWVIVFTHYVNPPVAFMNGHYDRFVLLWMDEDGDVQFPVDWEGTVEQAMIEIGYDAFMNQCNAAHVTWQSAHEMLDARPHEKFKRAQGQRRPSQTRH